MMFGFSLYLRYTLRPESLDSIEDCGRKARCRNFYFKKQNSCFFVPPSSAPLRYPVDSNWRCRALQL